MPRNDWRFHFSTKEVENAAEKRRCYHKERLDWWQVQKREAEEQLREKRTRYEEQAHTGGSSMQVTLDPTMQHRISECAAKIREHETAMNDYSGFARACSHEEDRALELSADDVRYFDL